MLEYILGFPTDKETIISNVVQYTDMQDAANSTSYCCAVFEGTLFAAVEKFMTIFEKQNNTCIQCTTPDNSTLSLSRQLLQCTQNIVNDLDTINLLAASVKCGNVPESFVTVADNLNERIRYNLKVSNKLLVIIREYMLIALSK